MINDINIYNRKKKPDLDFFLQKEEETAISKRTTLDVLADIEQSNKEELELFSFDLSLKITVI